MSRRSRGLISLVLALLLLAMQQEALRHAISHVSAAHEQQEVSSPQTDVRCVECSILAESTAALPSRPLEVFATGLDSFVVQPAHVAPALTRFTSHRSRAPPLVS